MGHYLQTMTWGVMLSNPSVLVAACLGHQAALWPFLHHTVFCLMKVYGFKKKSTVHYGFMVFVVLSGEKKKGYLN